MALPTPHARLLPYGIAVTAVVLAVLARMAVDPYLGNHLPYVTFFVAVAAVAWLGGLRPALASTALGFLASDWFFIAPRHSLWIDSTRDIVGAGSYFVVTLAIALLSHAMHKAREQTLARQRDMERQVAERQHAEAALRDSEGRFRALYEKAPLGIARIDSHTGRFLQLNTRYCDILGRSPAEALRLDFQAVTHPDDLAEDLEGMRRLRDGRCRSFEMDKRYLRPGGPPVWVHLTVVPEWGEGEPPSTHIAMVADITARKRAEEDLARAIVRAEQARAAAESASRAKDQFIAVLSHELRTPLTPVVAAMSLLRRDRRLPADVREDLEMVSRNIDLEVRLIADLLDVSRVISGKLYLEKRPTDVASAIGEAARIVNCDLDAKGQTLTIDTPGAPYLALADPARLQQVFWNLLRNSVKFSPERSHIAIRARLLPVEDCPQAGGTCPLGAVDLPRPRGTDGGRPSCSGSLVVEVIDQGSGISPEMQKRLFAPFEQDRKQCTVGGLGLGLSICKAVVEMHGGTISAQSEGVGHGATFTVRLPVTQCPLSPRAAPAEQGIDAGPGKPTEAAACEEG